MLAHRLADYYLLGHVVDNTMTGVKITRTPYCRMYVFIKLRVLCCLRLVVLPPFHRW